MKSTITLILLFISLSMSLFGQRVDEYVEISTKDGNNIIGQIVSMDDAQVILSTSIGEVTIPRDRIVQTKIKKKTDVEEKAYYGELDKNGYPVDYHNSTHYLANPSGYTLKKGQSYYENIGVFFNTYAYGITDRFTIAGGGEIISLLGSRIPILYISPRYSIPFGTESGSISVGSTIFTSPADNFEGFGVVQGAFTLGSRNNNFTVGTGFGFSLSDGVDELVLPFYMSFMTRISKKVSLVSDNFIFSDGNFNDRFGILSFAARIHFNNVGSAFNAGLWRTTEDQGDLLALPFVSATIALGK